jgi:PncC family amidohydrolase
MTKDEWVIIAERVGDCCSRGLEVGHSRIMHGWISGTYHHRNFRQFDLFQGGVIAYANEVKRDVLGVPQEVLSEHGAVSYQSALAMAQGVRRLLNVEVGVSVTGVAGPTGGQAKKPVGTVYIAVSSPLGDEVQHHVWQADRSGNKGLSAQAALLLVERHLNR